MKNNILHLFPSIALILSFFTGGTFTLDAQTCIGEKGKANWLLFENISNNDIRSMLTSPKYPRNPDFVEGITNLQTPTNYNNSYGSLIRGFIKAPQTGDYQFNLTGDDNSFFLLSTDTLKNNLVLLSQVPGWTNTTEHTKYPQQTSVNVPLVAGNYYYFEARHKEGGGGDFIWVYWKTPSNMTTWNIVPDSTLYESLCDGICPAAGTACNDGNPNTVNDIQDGNCNCIGTPTLLPFPCIGERGSLMSLYFDNITGSQVNNMLNDPDYPNAPNRAEILKKFQGPLTTANNYGARVRGYLMAPVSGNYKFNVTGDNEVRLRLSANQTTTAADEIAFNDGYTDPFDHTNTASQTSGNIFLQAGNFYSIELLHKESTGGDYFYVFWKTPFAVDTFWHVIDGTYLYRYACETACIPAGTPCNDGNANTFNDVYDSTCACAGTPCSDPACTNSLDYTPLEPCDAETDRHSTHPNNSWLSCQPTQSPNPERGVSHWIQYDFGGVYALNNAEIWNYNVANASAQGFKDVIIDYSLDGVYWSSLGTFNWAQAPGTPAYTGFDFTAFSSISARYVLITALNNFDGSNCTGLSEIIFNAETCPDAGTACDDGNLQTSNDKYNEFCYCVGTLTTTNDCNVMDLVKNEIPVTTGKYSAQLTITSAGEVRTGSNVVYVAGESITLNAGFEVEYAAEFLATIELCSNAGNDFGDFFKKLFKRKKKGSNSNRVIGRLY